MRLFKLIADAIQFFANLLQLSPILLGAIGCSLITVASVIAASYNFANTVVSLPLPILVVISIIAMYTIVKVIEKVLQNQKKTTTVNCGRLKWKLTRRMFSIRPIPICPHCEANLVLSVIPPPSAMFVQGPSEMRQAINALRYQFLYECPTHGQILVTDTTPEHLTALAVSAFEQAKKL